jgi:hypothetical protein
VVRGPQPDIAKGYWGSLYGERMETTRDGKTVGVGIMKLADAKEVAKVLKPDDFNAYYIRCQGQHVTIKVNGLTTVDDDFSLLPAEGIIAWQLHQGAPMEVTFKDIVFKELP